MKINVTIYDKDRKIVFDDMYDNCEGIDSSKSLVTIYAKNEQDLLVVINIPILGEMSFNARLLK